MSSKNGVPMVALVPLDRWLLSTSLHSVNLSHRPLSHRTLSQRPLSHKALEPQDQGLVAQRPVAQVQDRAVTKSDQHLKTDTLPPTIYKVLAFAVGSIPSKGQNKKWHSYHFLLTFSQAPVITKLSDLWTWATGLCATRPSTGPWATKPSSHRP